jgi:hypothetical protein
MNTDLLLMAVEQNNTKIILFLIKNLDLSTITNTEKEFYLNILYNLLNDNISVIDSILSTLPQNIIRELLYKSILNNNLNISIYCKEYDNIEEDENFGYFFKNVILSGNRTWMYIIYKLNIDKYSYGLNSRLLNKYNSAILYKQIREYINNNNLNAIKELFSNIKKYNMDKNELQIFMKKHYYELVVYSQEQDRADIYEFLKKFILPRLYFQIKKYIDEDNLYAIEKLFEELINSGRYNEDKLKLFMNRHHNLILYAREQDRPNIVTFLKNYTGFIGAGNNRYYKFVNPYF